MNVSCNRSEGSLATTLLAIVLMVVALGATACSSHSASTDSSNVKNALNSAPVAHDEASVVAALQGCETSAHLATPGAFHRFGKCVQNDFQGITESGVITCGLSQVSAHNYSVSMFVGHSTQDKSNRQAWEQDVAQTCILGKLPPTSTTSST